MSVIEQDITLGEYENKKEFGPDPRQVVNMIGEKTSKDPDNWHVSISPPDGLYLDIENTPENFVAEIKRGDDKESYICTETDINYISYHNNGNEDPVTDIPGKFEEIDSNESLSDEERILFKKGALGTFFENEIKDIRY